MNKYQELAKLIKDNNLKVVKRVAKDAASGWTGANIYVKDGDKEIFNLSINGFCFEDKVIEEAIKKIKEHIEFEKLQSFDAFKKYIDKIAVEVK